MYLSSVFELHFVLEIRWWITQTLLSLYYVDCLPTCLILRPLGLCDKAALSYAQYLFSQANLTNTIGKNNSSFIGTCFCSSVILKDRATRGTMELDAIVDAPLLQHNLRIFCNINEYKKETAEQEIYGLIPCPTICGVWNCNRRLIEC